MLNKKGEGIVLLVGLIAGLSVITFLFYTVLFGGDVSTEVNVSGTENSSLVNSPNVSDVVVISNSSSTLNSTVVNESSEDEAEIDNVTKTLNENLEEALSVRMNCFRQVSPKTCPTNDDAIRNCLDKDMVDYCEDEFNTTLKGLNDANHVKYEAAFYDFDYYLKRRYYCVKDCSFETYRLFYAYECTNDCYAIR